MGLGTVWGAILLLSVPSARAQNAEIPLWPDGAPRATGAAPTDIPTITPYPAANPNGAAVIVFPGGGYSELSTSHEGATPAQWLAGKGVSAFMLKYRLGSNNYHHPVEMWDAQRAVRWVRANAAKYRIETARVGVLGFSAGGHLASTVSTHYDGGNPGAADTIDWYPWTIISSGESLPAAHNSPRENHSCSTILSSQDSVCSKHRVERLMRESGLRAPHG